MPNIDEEARRYELEIAGRVGRAVLARRKRLRLTAVGVAERTKELGYPITRVTISKIENNARAGKIDVAELLILAVALEIPPMLLLFPDFPDGDVELIPGRVADSELASRWLAGLHPLPSEDVREPVDWSNRINAGVEVVEMVSEARRLSLSQLELRAQLQSRDVAVVNAAGTMLKLNQEELDRLERHVNSDLYDLWGNREEGESDE